jgi:hypothetical protein
MRGGVELIDTAERLVYESSLPHSDKADMLTGMAFLAGLVSKELTRHLTSSVSTRRLRAIARWRSGCWR